ncbi:LiaI-LiaF-like domain-containing protein [Emticicia sp. TH156]|uniref:LiaI-LiaF-like domain-containing protein n=1 Tax=Emticicia sp. TH156 TaxID=2067454 RepID=UPI000C76B450|nr:DUF5668 domain-containing protein [Emticicia sp. TH156]PLK42906.1 hypothetical protein C0V77_18520 [Emticicia sp. TH156]
MERKSSNIFLGAILIVIGILFLGTNLDWFELNWSFRQIARFWPLMLILAGVFAFLNRSRTAFNAASALLIAFAIPLGIFTCVDDGVSNFKDEFDNDWHVTIDDDDDDNYNADSDSSSNDGYKNDYSVPMGTDVMEAKLKLAGGAAEFDLEETTSNLFEAKTNLSYKTGYTLTEEVNNGIKTVEFEQKGKKGKGFNLNFDSDKNSNNTVLIKLNKAPVWDIEMGIGAGELDFDFSDYKVKRLDLNTGATDIDVKLGDKVDNVEVDINSGVTSVKISVPEGVGCELHMDGALNSKKLDGFEKVKSGLWRTPGYESTSKKIKIDADAGLSSIKINRY